MYNLKYPSIITLFIFSILLSLSFADYSDVLLVINDNSTDSVAIGNYFAAQRGIAHLMNVTLPNDSESIKFGPLNLLLLQPVRAYLNSSNGAGINYIVLSMDIPLRTSETEVDVTPGCGAGNIFTCQNASSVDSELMLMNTAYEQQVGKVNYAANPYYNKFTRFSRAAYGIYLVTRLDAANASTVYSMIDKSANIRRGDRASGLHILTRYLSFQSSQLIAANQTLSSAGLNVLFNSSSANAQYPANQSNVSYFDTFGCYNFGGCLSPAYGGNPNYTWMNGTIVNLKYSWSARYVDTPHPYESAVVDLLKEGATSGLGYAVEPGSSTLGDPAILATNYLNNFRTAELYWSSVNALSWAGVVFGDPKAGAPVADLNLTPLWPLTSNPQDLSCDGVLIDDFHSTLDVDYEWHKNGKTVEGSSIDDVPTGVPVNFATFDSSNLEAGDGWACKVSIYADKKESNVYLSSTTSANANVADPNNITSCRVLGTGNTVYVLGANVSSNGTCFSIVANDVTLDCRSHSINAFRPAGNIFGVFSSIFSNGDNTAIRNCNINANGAFWYGILLANQSNSTLQNTTVNHTDFSHGVYVKDSSHITIDMVRISRPYYGLFALNSPFITMTNSTLNTNGPAATFQGSGNSSTIGNAINSTNNAALVLTGSSNSLFTSNRLSSSSATFASITLNTQSNANTFLLNNITGIGWVDNSGANNTFNSSTAGNTHYLANGSLASAYYHIVDTTGDSYADAGCGWPLSSTTAPAHWIGNGQDAHPYTNIQCLTPQCIRQLMRTACALGS
jgi:uncharacterized protein (TIGR03790 family)